MSVPSTRIAADLDADVLDGLDFRRQNVARQPIGGDAAAQHAARFGRGFEDRHGVAVQAQKPGGRQSGRTGTDHGDFLSAVFCRFGQGLRRLVGQFVIGYEAFQFANRQRFIDLAAIAGRPRRDAGQTRPQTAGKGSSRRMTFKASGETSLADQRHVALAAGMHRAGVAAGRGALFFDGVTAGDGLRIAFADGAVAIEPHVVFVG